MATTFNFNGQIISLPGSYAQTKSGITNPPRNASYGNVLIVDTDETNVFGGGSGIAGQNQSGADAIYTFDNIKDFQNFVGGGLLWDIANPLFRPFGSGYPGVAKLIYVRALTTTGATLAITWENASFTVRTKHEGLVGNGVLSSGILSKGFGMVMEKGVVDTDKFRVRFLRGSFTGLLNNLPYNGLGEGKDAARILCVSPEFDNVSTLFAWMRTDVTFLNNFTLTVNSVESAVVTLDDLTDTVGIQLFTGATQSTSSATTDAVCDVIGALDYTHILSLDYGTGSGATGALSTDNLKLQYHIENEARYEKFLVIGGGKDKNEYDSVSKAAAVAYNSDKVIVIHGDIYDYIGSVAMQRKPAIYKAAYVLGRTAGLEPQTPPTFKGMKYGGEVHKMTDRERSTALVDGVLTTYNDTEIQAIVITQGITTLQQNQNLVNENGTSHLWSLKRIFAQLNKEIVINSKVELLGNQNQGPNRSTLSPQVVQDWVKSFLKRKECKPTVDNLIISWQDVTVSIQQDAYFISYSAEPNFEVNKLFFTSLIIDPNLQ